MSANSLGDQDAPNAGLRSRFGAILMDDQLVRPEFNEAHLLQRSNDGVVVLVEELKQLVVAYVAGGHDQEPAGRRAQEVTVTEVTIFGDNHAIVVVGHAGYLRVGGPVAIRELGGVNHIVSPRGDRAGQADR